MNIANAIAALTQVTRPRPGQDEAGIEAGVTRLFAAMREYPEDVALYALDYWPRHSEWFPTEHELRAVCDLRVGELARKAASEGGDVSGRFLSPVGKTAYFVHRCREKHGEPFCNSWLAGGVTCLFTNDTVYTTSIGVDRLTKQCWAELQESGVCVIESKDASKMLADYCDKRDLKFEPRGRGGRGR